MRALSTGDTFIDELSVMCLRECLLACMDVLSFTFTLGLFIFLDDICVESMCDCV